jgi:hypothetical protein
MKPKEARQARLIHINNPKLEKLMVKCLISCFFLLELLQESPVLTHNLYIPWSKLVD